MIYYEVLCLLLLLRNLFLVDRQLVIVMQSTEAMIIQLVCRRRVIIGRQVILLILQYQDQLLKLCLLALVKICG